MRKKILALGLIAIVSLAMLVSCIGKDPIIGTWKLSEASMSGITINAEQLKSMNMEMSLQFKEDGTVVMKMTGEDDENAKWKNENKDGKYTLTNKSGDKLQLKLKKNVLSFEQDGARLDFKKSDK